MTHALHHPLIEEVNLENASNIIINFTAGSSLTFSEVVDALTELQEKTHNQAEIIPGVITDERMGDRVQVIMILTGLGATPVEVPAFMQKITQPKPFEPSKRIGIPQPVAETHLVDAASIQNDLDIPAFLRRRIR